MEQDKLSRANENITELIDAYVNLKCSVNTNNCFRIVLLGKDRNRCCDNYSCDKCNSISRQEYRQALIERYIIK